MFNRPSHNLPPNRPYVRWVCVCVRVCVCLSRVDAGWWDWPIALLSTDHYIANRSSLQKKVPVSPHLSLPHCPAAAPSSGSKLNAELTFLCARSQLKFQIHHFNYEQRGFNYILTRTIDSHWYTYSVLLIYICTWVFLHLANLWTVSGGVWI